MCHRLCGTSTYVLNSLRGDEYLPALVPVTSQSTFLPGAETQWFGLHLLIVLSSHTAFSAKVCNDSWRPPGAVAAVSRFRRRDISDFTYLLTYLLRHCWLGIMKSIRPVKNWVTRCWRGCLSGVRCKWFAYGPAMPLPPHHLLLLEDLDWFYLSVASLRRLSSKRSH